MLVESSYTFEINEIGETSFILNNTDNKFKLNYNILKYEDLKELEIPKDNKLGNSYKKFLKIFKDFENYFHQYLPNVINIKIYLEFKIDKNNTENNLYNISVNYRLNNENNKGYKDLNTLNIDEIDKVDGFLYLIQEIKEIKGFEE